MQVRRLLLRCPTDRQEIVPPVEANWQLAISLVDQARWRIKPAGDQARWPWTRSKLFVVALSYKFSSVVI